MSAIRVRGSLVVERKSGRRGNFNVGELTTAIGIFDVKDTVIEQFEPGSYTGDFLIRSIIGGDPSAGALAVQAVPLNMVHWLCW